MAELFGGFDTRFHVAYREAWPLLPGYAEVRRPIYQLYYLLVHVNLFGRGYGAQAAPVLRHRLVLNYNAEAQGQTPESVIQKLIDNIPLHAEAQRHGRIESVLKA